MHVTGRHEKDRLATFEEPHRKKTLEHLALEFQFFRSREVTEQQAQDRRNAILQIVDDMYASIEREDPGTEKIKYFVSFLHASTAEECLRQQNQWMEARSYVLTPISRPTCNNSARKEHVR